jgi:hypothetical protein
MMSFPANTNLSVFIGGPNNGTWSLYSVNRFSGDTKTVTSGWTLTLYQYAQYIAAGNGMAITNLQATNIVGGSTVVITASGTNFYFTNGLLMQHSP